MQSEMMMLAGFLIIVGMAAGFYTLLQVTAGEGMLLGVVAVTIIMYAGGKARNFPAAVLVCGVIAAAGAFIFLLKNLVKRKMSELRGFFSMEMFLLTAVFLGAMFLFHGDFLQKIDDFHQWAAAVRYMLMKGHLPVQDDFLGTTSMPMYTSAFHLFFQELGGYNEGHMYVSSFFFNSVALLLPLAGTSWKKWKSSFAYVFTVYVGLYTLYLHSYKSLYVDLPAAAWAMAFCIWFSQTIRSERKRGKLILVGLPQVFMIAVIKQGIGILLLGFDLIYVVGDLFFAFGWTGIRDWISHHRKKVAAVLSAIAAFVAMALLLKGRDLLPVSGGGVREALMLQTDKAKLTLRTLMNKIVTRTLCSHSRIKAKALPTTCIFTALLALMAYIRKGKERKRYIWFAVFNAVSFVLYLAALYIVYVSTFSYEESVSNAAVHRYLSVIVLYQFFLVMAAAYGLLGAREKRGRAGAEAEAKAGKIAATVRSTVSARENTKGAVSARSEAAAGWRFRSARRIQTAVCAGLFLVFAAGMNSRMISDVSHYRFWKIASYSVIKETKNQLSDVDDYVPVNQKVYLLVQDKNQVLPEPGKRSKLSEFPMCIPLYYRTEGISNYLKEPWKFNEHGSLRLLSQTDIGIDSFPDMLTEGNYQYVWIYSVDDYITKELPRVLNVNRSVKPGLYQCIRDTSGRVTGLNFVTELG